MAPLEQRLAEQAAQGPDVLRRFMEIRQPIYQFGIAATMARAMQQQERLGTCAAVTAGSAALAKSDKYTTLNGTHSREATD